MEHYVLFYVNKLHRFLGKKHDELKMTEEMENVNSFLSIKKIELVIKILPERISWSR